MTTPTPYEESPTRSRPVPCPTQPVAGRTVDSENPVFDWTPVPDADQYRVQIAEHEAFEDLYYDEQTEPSTPIALGSILPDDVSTVCWRVRAETDDTALSDWSNTAHFARPSAEHPEDEAALRVEASPVPLHPDDHRHEPVDQSAASFSWERIPDASGYQLQVAATETFDDPTIDLSVDQTTSVTLCGMLPEEASPLYWRIRPLFRVAAPGPWCAPVRFSVSSTPNPEQDLAPEGEAAQGSARAAGPVQHARTSRGFTLFVSLVVVLSFIATIVLIALLG